MSFIVLILRFIFSLIIEKGQAKSRAVTGQQQKQSIKLRGVRGFYFIYNNIFIFIHIKYYYCLVCARTNDGFVVAAAFLVCKFS